MAIDAYCPKCQKNSVFRIVGSTYITKEKVEEIPKFGLVNIEAKCSRNGEGSYGNCPEKLFFCFNFNRDYKRLIKIGQYPSKAVLDFGELDPVFSQELDKDFREELGRAIGLRAHGVGVGSFVYLRRIFENLVEKTYLIAKEDAAWDEETEISYQKSRMPERIQLLKQHLPVRLVKNSHLYGILSKGIHELSEQECLSHFDSVQKAILMILKERHEDREFEQVVKELQKTSEKLSKPKNKAIN